MSADEILHEIQPLGTEGYRKILRNHGIPEPMFGVKIEDLKKIQKRIKTDYQLALDLYDTGVYDAMYLAGMIADAPRMTKADLRKWAKQAACAAVSEYIVAPVAAESGHGLELAREWSDSSKELIAVAGWSTFGAVVSITDDADLDLAELKKLLKHVQQTIHEQPNHVRYVMNVFVISVGAHVASLTDTAIKTAEKIGKVTVDVGNTACKVPSAPEYIRKIQARGTIGKKRKSARC
jgi:3-methyladenine DNA glycosylase AlkD